MTLRLTIWLGSALSALLVAGNGFAAGNEDEEKNEAAAGTNAEAKKRFAEGNERYARGDYDGAVESFKAAIAADPKLPGPYRNLGLAYRALNRCNDALPMYEKYLELKPESRFTDRVRREIDLCRAKLGTDAAAAAARDAHASRARRTRPRRRASCTWRPTSSAARPPTRRPCKIDGLVRGATPLTIPVTPGRPQGRTCRAPASRRPTPPSTSAPASGKDVELTMNKLPDEHAADRRSRRDGAEGHRAQGELHASTAGSSSAWPRRRARSAPASASPRASCTATRSPPIRRRPRAATSTTSATPARPTRRSPTPGIGVGGAALLGRRDRLHRRSLARRDARQAAVPDGRAVGRPHRRRRRRDGALLDAPPVIARHPRRRVALGGDARPAARRRTTTIPAPRAR